MSGLRLIDVSAGYEGRTVLASIDLEVAPGSWVGLIGPNGAGKSTLLKAVAGLIGHSGNIETGGTEISALSRRSLAQRVAYLPQRPVLPEGVDVADYVAIGRTPYIPYWRSETPSDLDVVRRVLARLDLEQLAHRPVDSLSGGEAQRVVLARALAQEPDVLLLDEPTSALDVGHQQQVLELIDRLRLDHGLTVIAAIHDLTLAAQFAEWLVLLDDGAVVRDGSPAEVLDEAVIARHFGATVRVVAGDEGEVSVVPVRRAARPRASLGDRSGSGR